MLVIRRFVSKSGQDVTHARVSGFAVSSLEINEQSRSLLGTTPLQEKSQRQDRELMVFSSAGFQNYTYNIYLWLLVRILFRLPDVQANAPAPAKVPTRGASNGGLDS